MNNEQFTQNLRRLRLEKGYTQERIAEQLQVSAQSVSRWECGNTLPDVMLLPRLAQAYGITIDDLYRQEPIPYPNYAHRLLAVYEATHRTEAFLAAEQEFMRQLGKDPTADDLRALGVLYHYMSVHSAAKAEEYLTAAMDQSSPEDWVYRSAAQQKIALLCHLGRGSDESAHYDRERETSPSDPLVWLLSIAAHHSNNDLETASTLVHQAIRLFPDNAALYVLAGDICHARKEYEEAFAHWQRVLDLDSDFLDARYSMAFCREELGEYDKALSLWRDLEAELSRRGLTQEMQLPADHIVLCQRQLHK